MLNRDLAIVGYWTDWDYVNDVLAQTIGQVRPARVVVVDPAEKETFETKAPALFALGERAVGSFQHVRASGAEFLNALRLGFSRSFVRRVLHTGPAEYHNLTGDTAPVAWTEPPVLDNETLWRVRRDLEGRMPSEPALSNW